MRTLLVDNYDSFTYNLFHYLAEVTGREPEVIRNDDPSWRPELLDGFDAVVLSPGPGTPHNPADFGHCAAIAREGRLPVLGVCLGHQGLALAHGAAVGRAPAPRHGRTSAVRHTGTGLFRRLPNPLEVVRYHSLAVTALAPGLDPVAWATDDGVVMALQHHELPLWGVQFHPESIGTEAGHQLLANFRDLAEDFNRTHRPGPRPLPSAAPVPAVPAAPAARRLTVLSRTVDTRWDAEAVFDRLFRTGDHPFWLDSSLPGGRLGRISVMGDASGPLARVATADVNRGTVTVRSGDTVEVVRGAFLDWLDADLRSLRTEVPELPFDFALGWVGCLGYELKAECGGDRAHRSPDPDAVMVFADRAVVLDHGTGAVHLLALVEEGRDEGGADDRDRSAAAWLSTTTALLAGPAAVLADPAPVRPGEPVPLRLRHRRRTYLQLIDACQDEISAGETYEVCLTNMIDGPAPADPWQAYRALRRISPAPFAAFLCFDGLSVLSSSPERFLRIGPDGVMESKPIKGTRPRGATAVEDTLLIADLAASEKDRAENLMVVDLVRHDLGSCAETGSVVAEPLFDVETYATVHQLVSTVRARLRPGRSAVDGVRAAFPGGSMTGTPKLRTMQIIDRLENGPRGIYSGAIGYFSLTGAADLSIVIRTAVLSGGRLRYGVGGAIIALSDAEGEFDETVVKARPLLALLGTPFPGQQPSAPPRARRGSGVGSGVGAGAAAAAAAAAGTGADADSGAGAGAGAGSGSRAFPATSGRG
ncbi:aminodeoxychorismate synthase component I [Kitasatospora sp. NPDC094011]|uniref:aminodeoxychorismate synthase component I n=1 Tax=Kitasatospora sp. NPDC094011 TaxID=3364090 RepID=UPI0038139FDC